MNVYILLCLGKYNMEEQHLNKQFKDLAILKAKKKFFCTKYSANKKLRNSCATYLSKDSYI